MKFTKRKVNTGPTMNFAEIDKPLSIQGFSSVLEVALANKIELGHSCGGMGCCTTCRVIVLSDINSLPPRNELEQEMADMKGFRADERLACQLKPVAELKVAIPKSEDH